MTQVVRQTYSRKKHQTPNRCTSEEPGAFVNSLADNSNSKTLNYEFCQDVRLDGQICDRCETLIPADDVHRFDNETTLCPSCYSQVDELPSGKLKDSITRFLTGNVV